MFCWLTDPITTYLLHCYYVIEIKGFICVLAKNLRWRQRCTSQRWMHIYKYIYCNWTNSIITVTVLSALVRYYICSSRYLQQQQSSSFTFWLWLFRLWMVVYFLLSWSFQLLTTYSVVRREHAKGSLDQIQRRLPSRALCILCTSYDKCSTQDYHWYIN